MPTQSVISGYRTIIAVAVSMVLKLLVAKGFLHSGEVQTMQDTIVDLTVFLLSFVSDGFAIYFRMIAAKPGPLAKPELVLDAAIQTVKDHTDDAKKVSTELSDLLKEHAAISQKIIAMGKGTVINAETK